MTAPAIRNLRRRSSTPTVLIDPLQVHQVYAPATDADVDSMEFTLSDKYLNQPSIYPRQATLLKCWFLEKDLLTQYDYDVIGEWGETFARTGNEGCQPDLLERMDLCIAQGRPYFREIIAVVGRRGSKGFSGAVAGAKVLWRYLNRPGGPQSFYGLERNKRLTAIVFAGKKEQAKVNQWRDLTNMVVGAPCFAPYISRPLAESLTVFAPSDIIRAQMQALQGVDSEADLATFEIVPKESTLMAGRGPASFMLFFDEMAHVVATGINRSAEEVYNASTPSLDQFGLDGFIYAGSSPWQMTGRFYELWLESLAKDPDGRPSYPEKFMIQLPSWGPYADWHRSELIPIRPKRTFMVYIEQPVSAYETTTVPLQVASKTQHFMKFRRPLQAYDENMKQLEKSNPDNFAVERRSHWASVLDAYLDAKRVEQIFLPWMGRQLRPAEKGLLAVDYVAHGDPGHVNDKFGYALAHAESVDGVKHVVFDIVHGWWPSDWESREIDYEEVGARIKEYLKNFMPVQQTFDQFNSISTIADLRKYVARSGFPKHIDVYEKTATAPLNWKRFEVFKAATYMGLIHAPMVNRDGSVNRASELAELELRFLQDKGGKVDHPSSGPVQSKDIADCMVQCVWALIGPEVSEAIGAEFTDTPLRGTMGGGANPYSNVTSPGTPGSEQKYSEVAEMFSHAGGSTYGSGPLSAARGRNTPNSHRR